MKLNYEALVTAISLQKIYENGPGEHELSVQVDKAIEDIAQNFTTEEVTKASYEAAEIWEESADLNHALVRAGFENQLHALYFAFFPFSDDECEDLLR